ESIKSKILDEVRNRLKNGMTTKEIYQMAFKILKSKSRVNASRYKLKRAIMELGPSGYPFENFVGKILKYEGYQTEVGVIVQGHCVTHEVDVIALKDNEHLMIECKYHNTQNQNCDVKIPLYIQSRFKDVEAEWKNEKGHSSKIHYGCIYTNTRFSKDALQYGECAGLKLTSWDYPKDNSLKYRIDKLGLHPLTSLMSLSKAEKTMLLNKDIVLCREIHQNPEILNEIGISKIRQKRILVDSKILCEV
ncbi:ATPase, partial [bacterium]